MFKGIETKILQTGPSVNYKQLAQSIWTKIKQSRKINRGVQIAF